MYTVLPIALHDKPRGNVPYLKVVLCNLLTMILHVKRH